MNEQNTDPFGNIWITGKIRMAAHDRFARMDRTSHIVLTAYSVALLSFSVAQPHLTNSPLGPYSSEISIVLSLSILCASLVIWGLGFGQRARDHRECYLALQRLYDADFQADEKKAAYQDILDKYPNHSGLDKERFLFWRIRFEGARIKTHSGQVEMGFWRSLRYLIWEVINFSTAVLLIFAPAIVVYLIYALS